MAVLLSVSEHIEHILTDYFNPKQIQELKKLINFDKIPAGSADSLLGSEKYNSGIDNLVTYAADKLSISKRVELLLHLGELSISMGEMQAATGLYKQILLITDNSPELENVKAYSFMALGDIFSRQAEWTRSIRYLNKAQKLFDRQKDFRGSAKCENILGTIYGDRGNIKRAKMHFEKSLSYLDQKQDEYLIGMIEINLGIIGNIQANYDQAFTFHQRAIIKFEQMQDSRRLAEVRNNLGMLHTIKGEFSAALNVYDQSISVSLRAGYLPTLVISYLSKAFIYAQLKDFNLANAFSDKAMEGAVKLNDRLSIADIYKIKGVIEKNLENYAAAENYFVTSIRINQELQNILNIAETAYELGLMYIELERKEDAIKQLTYCLTNYKKLDAVVMVEKLQKTIRGIK